MLLSSISRWTFSLSANRSDVTSSARSTGASARCSGSSFVDASFNVWMARRTGTRSRVNGTSNWIPCRALYVPTAKTSASPARLT